MTIKSNAMGSGTPGSQAGALVGGVTNNVAAAGASQATATLLAKGSNQIVTTGTGGVILPPGVGSGDALQAGDWIRVFNYTGSSINVYPPTGGKIANGSANAAMAVAATKGCEFICIDGANFAANLSA